jgi:hypothetical protein
VQYGKLCNRTISQCISTSLPCQLAYLRSCLEAFGRGGSIKHLIFTLWLLARRPGYLDCNYGLHGCTLAKTPSPLCPGLSICPRRRYHVQFLSNLLFYRTTHSPLSLPPSIASAPSPTVVYSTAILGSSSIPMARTS